MRSLDHTKLGVSRFPAIMGADKYASAHDAWAEILGLPERERPGYVEEAAEDGLGFQSAIFKGYCRKLDLDPNFIVPDQSRTPPTKDFLRYTPDVVFPTAGLCECKLISTFRFEAESWGKDGTDQVPDRLLYQVTGQIACMRLDADFWRDTHDIDPFAIEYGGVAACEVAFGRLRHHHYKVPYSESLGEMLLEEAERFWVDYVLTKTPPPPDGSEACAEWLDRQHPQRKTDRVRDADFTEAQNAIALGEIKQRIAELEDSERLLTNRLKASIGDDLGIRGDGFVVRWKNFEGAPKWKGVAEALANIHNVGEADFAKIVEANSSSAHRRFEAKYERVKAGAA